MDTNGQETKDIRELTRQSIQSSDEGVYMGNFTWLGGLNQAGQLAPIWWSQSRDSYLFDFAMRSNYFLSAVYKAISKLTAIQPRVLPRNPNIQSHQTLAAEYNQKLLEGSDFGQGWGSLFSKSLFDYFIQDNGAFIEVIGGGNKGGPLRGPALGLAVLDSSRCTRTGDREYPVVYRASDAKYKLHWTRVIALSSMTVPKANKNGVGICWLSRTLDIAQTLFDMIVYKQEKLGSRPKRQILLGRGISTGQIANAIKKSDTAMDNQGLNIYSKSIVIGSNNTEIGLEAIDIASVPDGFDFQTDLEMGMFAIAMAGGIPPRDLWPATTTGATKADAMYQHVGGGAGYSTILDAFVNAIGGNPDTPNSRYARFLPPSLKLVFDYVDDTQDERSANISKTRSETRERDINNGVITVRVARQQMLDDGELTDSQFDQIELKDGRLPDGTPILRLFNTSDEFTQELLHIGLSDALDIEANLMAIERDEILKRINEQIRMSEMIVVNSSRQAQKQKAEQAIAALGELLKLYEGQEDNQAVEDNNEESEQKEKIFKPSRSVAREAKWEQNQEKQVSGGPDMPPEVEEYESEVADLIEQGTDEEITQEEFEGELEAITVAAIIALFLRGAGVSSEADLDDNQREALGEMISEGTQSIGTLGDEVYSGTFVPVDDGGLGHNIIDRAILWASFAAGVWELGKLHDNRSNPFLKWNRSPGKDSCTDCVRYNGQVHRREDWLSRGISPKRRNLECKGYRCGCYFTESDGPESGNY